MWSHSFMHEIAFVCARTWAQKRCRCHIGSVTSAVWLCTLYVNVWQPHNTTQHTKSRSSSPLIDGSWICNVFNINARRTRKRNAYGLQVFSTLNMNGDHRRWPTARNVDDVLECAYYAQVCDACERLYGCGSSTSCGMRRKWNDCLLTLIHSHTNTLTLLNILYYCYVTEVDTDTKYDLFGCDSRAY